MYPPYGPQASPVPTQRVVKPPKRKTVQEIIGVILAVLGVIGVALAAIEYPIWTHNSQVLADKEYWGVATQEDYDTVEFQTIIVIGGFVFGGIFLLVGIILAASAMSYNSKLDTATIQRSFGPSIQQYAMPQSQKAFYPVPPTAQTQHRYILTDAPAFCPYCGTPMHGALKCSNCGRFFA